MQPQSCAPPELHEWATGHFLECGGEREFFYWSLGILGRSWVDQRGTAWCPTALALMGWTYVCPVRRSGPIPKAGTFRPSPLDGIKLAKARTDLDYGELLRKVEGTVSRNIPITDRADICQDTILETLETNRPLTDLPKVVHLVISRHAAMFDAWKPYVQHFDEAYIEKPGE